MTLLHSPLHYILPPTPFFSSKSLAFSSVITTSFSKLGKSHVNGGISLKLKTTPFPIFIPKNPSPNFPHYRSNFSIMGKLLISIPMAPLFLLCFIPFAFAAHDYGSALSKSLLFFEAQRSGVLPGNQRVTWRYHSGLQDGKASGVSLHDFTFCFTKKKKNYLEGGFCFYRWIWWEDIMMQGTM